jgi:putative SOS response-associated peptidase YedK
MPVIIPERDYDRWLQPGDPAQPPVDLLRPYDADKMTAWKVDKAVGNVKNDTPELIQPASETLEGCGSVPRLSRMAEKREAHGKGV